MKIEVNPGQINVNLVEVEANLAFEVEPGRINVNFEVEPRGRVIA